jgi:phytoene desaturase
MGPSWYLMPDLFDDFFRSFGLTIEDYLTLSPLDPSYKIYFNGSGKHIDVYKEVEKNRPEFERIEPGSTDKLHQYLETASYQYKIAMESFVPKNYDNIFDFFTRRMMTEGRKMNVLGNLHSYVQKYFKTPEMQKIMEYALVFL